MDDMKSWKAISNEHRGITMGLAEFIATLRAEVVPVATREVLAKAVVDAIGCGLCQSRIGNLRDP